MDDQQTEPAPQPPGRETPAGLPWRETPADPPPPPAPPPPPPPPPPSPVRTPPPHGWVSSADVGRPVIDIGSIIGRTFDTFGREWSLFLALAAPAAFGSLLQSVIAPATMASATAEPTLESLWPTFVATIVGSLISLLSTVTITAATDHLWQGGQGSVAAAVAGGLRALPRFLGVILLLGVVVAAASLVAAILVVGTGGSGPGVALVVLAMVVLVPVAVWIGARLTLLGPVIVLEDEGITGSIRRAWDLSRGHVLLLFVLSLAIGIVSALPLWGASLFAAFVPDPVIAGVGLAIATLVSQPLPVIAVTLAWGDRIGGRHADSEVMARGRGRGTAALLVFGLGVILLIVGLGVAAQYARSAGPAFP